MGKNKGITLIALVITIVVLIILAGVTINIIFDNDGIISKAKEAGETTKREGAREKVIVLLAEYEIEASTRGINISEFFAEKKDAGEIDTIVEDIEEHIIIELDGYEFTIDATTREITNVADTNIRINISYPEGTVGEIATALVTVTNNKKTVDSNSLVYGWSNSKTIEPASWTIFTSGAEITHAVGQGEIWFLWVKANYEGGTVGTESKRVSSPFSDVDITPPTANVSYNPDTITEGPVVATITTNEEIQTPSGWTKTSATTYTKTYTSNTAETVSITDLANNTGSVNISVTNILIIPTGFTGSIVDGGIIITGPDGSEFVWVPVSNPVLDVQGKTDTEINTAIAAEVAAGRYPMAIKVDSTNYKGVVYNFALDTSTTPNGVTISPKTYATTSTQDREPDVLTGTGFDNTAANYSGAGITGITSAAQFKTQLQNEYNQMIASIITNGGFYIGRYETSLNGGNVQSKVGVTPMVNINWYNMYQKQKLYVTNNSISGIASSMIWGSAWDQVIIWMKDIRNPNSSNTPYIIDSIGMGWYSDNSNDQMKNTGTLAAAEVKNIFDMAGNLNEWSIETRNGRNYRGGYYKTVLAYRSASYRGSGYPSNTGTAEFGSRMLLY